MFDTMAEGGWAASLKEYVKNHLPNHAEDQGNVWFAKLSMYARYIVHTLSHQCFGIRMHYAQSSQLTQQGSERSSATKREWAVSPCLHHNATTPITFALAPQAKLGNFLEKW